MALKYVYSLDKEQHRAKQGDEDAQVWGIR